MAKSGATPTNVTRLPVLRQPRHGDEDWDDQTGPMTLYHPPGYVPPPPAAMQVVRLTPRDADWAARLVELALSNLGPYLSPGDAERGAAIARKLRGEV